ncbi:MAG: DHH family phosphoesterase [Cellulosilyticaceae bacterium]
MSTVIEKLVAILKNNEIKEVAILGHDNIDEDSCISALLLRTILNYYNIEGTIKIIADHINDHTLSILTKLGYDMNEYLTEETNSEEYLFLVDHYCTTHPGNIIGCIDHHPTQQLFEYPIYENDRASACCKKIYDYMLEGHIPINKEIIKLVVYGVMIDTFAFKSSRGTQEDKKWVEEMIESYQLDYQEMYKDALSLTDLEQTVEKLALTNLKEYNFYGNKVKSTYIQVEKEPEKLEQILRYLKEKTQKAKLAMWVFLLVDVSNIKTIEYRITQNEIQKINHEKLTSRAQGIMPEIEKYLLEKSS